MKKMKCGLIPDASADGDKGQENGRVGAMREVTGGVWATENATDGGSGAIARKHTAMRIKVNEGMRQWANKERTTSIVVGVWAEGQVSWAGVRAESLNDHK